jgi:hypothetical protein
MANGKRISVSIGRSSDPVLQRHAIQTLNGDEGLRFSSPRSEIVHMLGGFRADVGFRLPPKSLQSVVILGYVAGQFARGRRQVNL